MNEDFHKYTFFKPTYGHEILERGEFSKEFAIHDDENKLLIYGAFDKNNNVIFNFDTVVISTEIYQEYLNIIDIFKIYEALESKSLIELFKIKNPLLYNEYFRRVRDIRLNTVHSEFISLLPDGRFGSKFYWKGIWGHPLI